MPKDTIFTNVSAGSTPFRFDESVAAVFPDMIKRSVPGYARSLDGISEFARRLVPAGGRCYDLGCSLGAASLAISLGLGKREAKIIAVDNSPAMIARCEENDAFTNLGQQVSFVEQDIVTTPIENANLVVMNYTLQFIDPALREAILQRIYDNLEPGGALILSEKFHFDDRLLDELIFDVHLDFKRRNDYSELEIAGKRAAIENVLITDSSATHLERLRRVGFSNACVWLQELNFGSIIALRSA